MGKGTRKKLFVDESRIWNFTTSTIDRKLLRSFMFGYFWHDDIVESYFGINRGNLVWVLRYLTNLEKNLYLRHFDAKNRYSGNLYTSRGKQWTVLKPIFAARTRFL